MVFDGFVRNNFKGGKTLYLEYEAYEPMAYAKMREIGAEIRAKFSIHRVAIVHRLGRLEIGETSVWIAVSAAHRGAAFDACRYAIDTLKRAVPIWKKEYFRRRRRVGRRRSALAGSHFRPERILVLR